MFGQSSFVSVQSVKTVRLQAVCRHFHSRLYFPAWGVDQDGKEKGLEK